MDINNLKNENNRLEPFIVDPISSLPFISGDLPGIGGELKKTPGHFVVEEIPLYEPLGEGNHLYVQMTREGWTTHALQKRLCNLFNLRPVDVGSTGLKDKQARVTQVFSLLLPDIDKEIASALIQKELPVKVNWARRHRNKLRTGHLLGNRFRITVSTLEPDALAMARAIAEVLQKRGLPNYYGAQRFGAYGDNAVRGREILLLGHKPRERWLKRFLVSAYQSALFNAWLAGRIDRGWFDSLLAGDIAKKTDTGGLFEVKDAQVEKPRFEQKEITYTGPIYGTRMRQAAGKPGELESEILKAARVTSEMFRRTKSKGSRRVARLFLWELDIESHSEGLLFTLALPKGAYATTVLREFMKKDLATR